MDNTEKLTSTSIRLKKATELLFENDYQPKFSLNRVAESLGLKNETEFHQLLNGEIDPSFEFLDLFAENYGINKDWLKYGEKSPFVVNQSQLFATEYLSIIKNLKPKEIFLIREDSSTGKTGIILKLGEWKYSVLGKSYHISSEVGGTGQLQIKKFYELLVELGNSGYNLHLNSKMVSQEIYSKLFSGNASPAILNANNHRDIKNSYWADDFMDYEYKYRNVQDYQTWYGEEFIKAQKILKYQLQK